MASDKLIRDLTLADWVPEQCLGSLAMELLSYSWANQVEKLPVP